MIKINLPYVIEDEKYITGTLIWYYFICKREVWLMGHEITPDQEYYLLDIGRAVHETSYNRFMKEVKIEGAKFDIYKKKSKVLCEIKTSSKFLEAAKHQLLYYLYRLRKMGIEARGEILVPKEKKKLTVELDDVGEKTILNILEDIKDILKSEKPPEPIRTKFCRRCSYKDFCWV